jgi:Phage integrase family
MTELLLDAAGRRRSPATMPGFHAGRPPRTKGQRYRADPPTVEVIVAVMRAAGDGRHGCRLRGLIVVLWRAGLRIHEALALNESDLDHRRGALLVRRGKGGRRREVGMDEWAWEHCSGGSTCASSSPSARCSASSTAAAGVVSWGHCCARSRWHVRGSTPARSSDPPAGGRATSVLRVLGAKCMERPGRRVTRERVGRAVLVCAMRGPPVGARAAPSRLDAAGRVLRVGGAGAA